MSGEHEEATYHGQPLSELLIAEIDWTERADHIRTRSIRKPGDLDIEPEWATEAAFDEERLIGLDPGSKSGWGLRLVGRSQQMNRVSTVILIPQEPGFAGRQVVGRYRLGLEHDRKSSIQRNGGDQP